MEKEKIVVIVCVIYFAAMVLIGVIAARRNKATSDYLVAGRKLNVTMTAITLAAVQIGTGRLCSLGLLCPAIWGEQGHTSVGLDQ